MDYRIFKHINGKQIDFDTENYELKDIIYLLLDNIGDGILDREVYRCTYLDGFEVETDPKQDGFELHLEIRFDKKYNLDYFEYLLNKRLENINQLELCLANSIDEV